MPQSNRHHHIRRRLRCVTAIAFLILLVSACSSGDESSPKLAPGGTLEEYAEQAVRRYGGATEPAVLDASAATRFFDIAMWGAFRADPLSNPMPTPAGYSSQDTVQPPQLYARSPLHWDRLFSINYRRFFSDNSVSSSSCGDRDPDRPSYIDSLPEAPDQNRKRTVREYCRDDGGRNIEIHDYVGERLVESWFGYDRATYGNVYNRDVQRQVSGTVHMILSDGCSHFGNVDATLLIEDLDTGEQVLVEDFERTSQHTYASSFCVPYADEYVVDFIFPDVNLANPQNRFSGRISHSILGSTTVSTDEHLGFAVDFYYPSDFYGRAVWPVYRENADGVREHAPGGPVVLTGVDGQTAALETSYRDQHISPSTAYFKLSLFDNDGSLTDELRASPEGFVCGSLSSTTDFDRDGLPDAWEICNGLDPDNNGDADLDEDKDGLSNRDEYEHLSRPDTPDGVALLGAQGLNVSMSSEFDSEDGISYVSLSPSAFALNSATIPDNNTYVLTLDKESSWDLDRLTDECVVQANSIQSIVCTIDYGEQTEQREFQGKPLYFSRTSAAQGTLTATLVADASDPLLRAQNQQVSVEKKIPGRLSVSMPAWSAGHSDEVRELIVSVERHFEPHDYDSYVKASFDVPDGVVIESAGFMLEFNTLVPTEFNTPGPEARHHIEHYSCSISTSVSCYLDDDIFGDQDNSHVYASLERSFRFDITVRYYVLQAGSHDITWNFQSDHYSKGSFLISQTSTVEQFQSTESLQALIYEAIAGKSPLTEKVVTLPAGTYAGTLDGRGHRLVLRGATEGEPTVLVPGDSNSPIATGLLEGSRLEHLEIRGTGAPLLQLDDTSYITIANSRIVPLPDQPHQVSNLISGKGNHLLIGNEFSGWGVGEDNHCESLLSLEPDYAAFVDHNVFVDNHCDQLIDIDAASQSNFDDGTSAPLTLVVQNNTFLNNPSLISLKPHGEPYVIHLKNNIVVGAESVFVAKPEDDFYQPIAPSGIVSSANLLWNSGTESMLPSEPSARARAVTEVADLHVDPLLANETQSPLSPWSPAIDAGVEPTSFETMQSILDVQQGDLKTDIQIPYEPLDGLGDGKAVHDIGADEYELPNR